MEYIKIDVFFVPTLALQDGLVGVLPKCPFSPQIDIRSVIDIPYPQGIILKRSLKIPVVNLVGCVNDRLNLIMFFQDQ